MMRICHRLIIYILIVLFCALNLNCLNNEDSNIVQNIDKSDGVSEPNKDDLDVISENLMPESETVMTIYLALFKQKRATQLDAVKTIVNLDDFEKQYKMLQLLLEKLFKVTVDSRDALLNVGITTGDPIPTEEAPKNAYSSILENTAFLGEIALRLPEITHTLFSRHDDWLAITEWAVEFSSESGVFRGPDAKLLNLMSQELRLIDRDPLYINPYAKVVKPEVSNTEKTKSNKKKKKKALKRGPRLSGGIKDEL